MLCFIKQTFIEIGTNKKRQYLKISVKTYNVLNRNRIVHGKNDTYGTRLQYHQEEDK